MNLFAAAHLLIYLFYTFHISKVLLLVILYYTILYNCNALLNRLALCGVLQEKCKEDEEAEGECPMGGAGAGAGGKPLVADKITYLVVESAPLTLAGAGGGRPLQLVACSLPIVLIVNVSQVCEQHSTVLHSV